MSRKRGQRQISRDLSVFEVLTFVLFLYQATFLNSVIYTVTPYATYPLVIVEVIGGLYYLYHHKINHAAKCGATLWVGYAWLTAAKILIIYLEVTL